MSTGWHRPGAVDAVDARLAGVAVGAAALWFLAPLVVALVLAAATAATGTDPELTSAPDRLVRAGRRRGRRS